MPRIKRPRVAAIGLDDDQLASIESLCGELRAAESLEDYERSYSMTETDVLVASALNGGVVDSNVNLMAIGEIYFLLLNFSDTGVLISRDTVETNIENTERELAIRTECPDPYRPLAAELTRQLSQATEPPTVINTTRGEASTAGPSRRLRPSQMGL